MQNDNDQNMLESRKIIEDLECELETQEADQQANMEVIQKDFEYAQSTCVELTEASNKLRVEFTQVKQHLLEHMCAASEHVAISGSAQQ